MKNLSVKHKIIQFCSFCDESLIQILDLGHLTPVNQLVKIDDCSAENNRLMVKLLFCEYCGLSQLSTIVEEEFLFPPDYPFRSGTTYSLRNNFAEQATLAIKTLHLRSSDLVVDIGSNDGTLLSEYCQKTRVLGIEPTNSSTLAIKKGIPTIQKFFSPEVAEEIVLSHEKAKLVTLCNILAHVPDPKSLLQSVKVILDDSGVIIIEVHYLLSLVESLQFDSLYFEHLRFYDANSLNQLLLECDLEIFKIQKIRTHGGSLRVWVARPGVKSNDPSVDEFLANEIQSANFGKQGLETFAENVLSWRISFRQLLSQIQVDRKIVYGIGAPSRGSMLLNFSGLDVFDIPLIAEGDDSPKLDCRLPDSRIPIVTEDFVLRNNPDYLLLLSWHVADEIIPKIRAKGFLGKFIIPLPRLLVISE
jgi:hypothetical protein